MLSAISPQGSNRIHIHHFFFVGFLFLMLEYYLLTSKCVHLNIDACVYNTSNYYFYLFILCTRSI